MAKQRGFWSSLFGSPERDRFSVEELAHLHVVLLRNQVVTESNRETVVETLRSIAELVIWGDQHDSAMVEYFLTENLLAHFNRILQQRSNRRGDVAMQVLQTLSILIQNVRNQQTVYYLFSNNHINEIVSMRFDFEDDEVLGYYVNLLKAISLKLNEATVQFFFQANGGAGTFPLYTEAIKFVGHRDGMVRTAVKTLTLNVYGIPLPALHAFVCRPPASAYLHQLGALLAEHCQVLDRQLSSWDVSTPHGPSALESTLADIEDLLSYCNDVLCTGVPPLRALLLDTLWQQFVGPVLLWPLVQEDVPAQHILALNLGVPPHATSAQQGLGTAGVCGGSGRGSSRGSPPPGTLPKVDPGIVGPLCSLYVMERLLAAVTHTALLSPLVSALLGGAAAGGGCRGGGWTGGKCQTSSSGGSPWQQRASPAPSCCPSPSCSGLYQCQKQQHDPQQQQEVGEGEEKRQLPRSFSLTESTGGSRGCTSPGGGSPCAGNACPNDGTEADSTVLLPPDLLARLQYNPVAYRGAFLCALRHGSGGDPHLAAAAVRVLAAILQSRAVEEELLEMIGLLPRRRLKQRRLLAALTETPHTSLASLPTATPSGQPQQPNEGTGVQKPVHAAQEAVLPVTATTPSASSSSSSSAAAAAAAAAAGACFEAAHLAEQQQAQQTEGQIQGDAGQQQQQQAQQAQQGSVQEADLPAQQAEQDVSTSAQVPTWDDGSELAQQGDTALPMAACEEGKGGGAGGGGAGAMEEGGELLCSVASTAGTTPNSGRTNGSSGANSSCSPGSVGSLGVVDASLPHSNAAQQAGLCDAVPQPSSTQQGAAHPAHAATSHYGEAQFAELADALLGLLSWEQLPPLALLTLGRLLGQLLCVGAAGAELSPTLTAGLDAAVRRAQAAVRSQLQGPWCDVLREMVAASWGKARGVVLRGSGGGLHAAVHTWMQGILAQELRWQLADHAAEVAAANAATAAQLAYLSTHTLLALTQIQQLLSTGDVAPHPPLSLPPAGWTPPASGFIKEGSFIPLSTFLSCVVAFARGQERKVYFAVDGLPGYVKASALPSAPSAPSPPAPSPAAAGEAGHSASPSPTPAPAPAASMARVKPEALSAALAAASPVVVVADPSSRPHVGVVLSAAPLLGAFPRTDEQHPKWLHVQVRPQPQAFLSIVEGSHWGNALLSLERGLVSGHWVLAFPAADKAEAALKLVEESAEGVRAMHAQLLAPLLGEGGAAEDEDGS